jgi:hypothetical protein
MIALTISVAHRSNERRQFDICLRFAVLTLPYSVINKGYPNILSN